MWSSAQGSEAAGRQASRLLLFLVGRCRSGDCCRRLGKISYTRPTLIRMPGTCCWFWFPSPWDAHCPCALAAAVPDADPLCARNELGRRHRFHFRASQCLWVERVLAECRRRDDRFYAEQLPSFSPPYERDLRIVPGWRHASGSEKPGQIYPFQRLHLASRVIAVGVNRPYSLRDRTAPTPSANSSGRTSGSAPRITRSPAGPETPGRPMCIPAGGPGDPCCSGRLLQPLEFQAGELGWMGAGLGRRDFDARRVGSSKNITMVGPFCGMKADPATWPTSRDQ